MNTQLSRRIKLEDLPPDARAKHDELHRDIVAERLRDGPPANTNGVGIFFDPEIRQALDKLTAARIAAGLSVAELAEKIGVSVEELEEIESRRSVNPTWKLLGDYAHALGLKLKLEVSQD